MRKLLFAFAIVFAIGLALPGHAHAQTAGWYYANTGTCSGSACASAMAACEAYRAQDTGTPTAVIVAFSPNPRLNEYYTCSVNGPIDGTAGIYLNCPGGDQSNYTSPGSCSLVPMNPKTLGPACSTPPPNTGGIPANPGMSNDPNCNNSGPIVYNSGIAYGGDPVNIATGNMAYAVTDYTTAGQNSLMFIRYYNSRGASYLPLGSGWRTNFTTSMFVQSGSNLVLYRADGKVLNYAVLGGAWVTDSDMPIGLKVTGSTYSFTDQYDTTDNYVSGALQTRVYRNGYTQTMHYTGSNLTSVTDSYGRTLTFTYNPDNSLASVETPDRVGTGDMVYTQDRRQGLQIWEEWLFNEGRNAGRCVYALERESYCGSTLAVFVELSEGRDVCDGLMP